MSRPLSASAASQPGVDVRSHRWRRLLAGGLPNVVTFGLLAMVFMIGHHTGWKLPNGWQRSGLAATAADDWCPEHLVPESSCIECNERLFPKPHEFGFCDRHGVFECVIDHPELAQVEGAPRLPPYDTVKAIAFMTRPANNTHDTLHLRRVQFASAETAVKSGIEVDTVRERSMTDVVVSQWRSDV